MNLPETTMPDDDEYAELQTREVIERRIDLRTGEIEEAPDPRSDRDDDGDDLDLDDEDLDLDVEYPS